MARQTGADAIRESVEPVVRDADLYLEDVTVSRAGSRSVVRITLDLPEDALGSLDLDTVADVSREISTVLDSSDVLHGAFTLEVSTPGTSRPLTERRHFKRARGRIVRLDLVGGGTAEGRLTDVDDALHLTGDGDAPRVVALADVVAGRVQVEMSRTLGADDDGDVSQDALDDDTTGTPGPHDEEV